MNFCAESACRDLQEEVEFEAGKWADEFPVPLLRSFEEDCFAGVAKRSDYGPLGDHFDGSRQTAQ
jgi:hypothetical protein